MDNGDHTISLEKFNSWKLDASRIFLSVKWLSTDGTKAELAAVCFAANAMKVPFSDCEYVSQLQKEYIYITLKSM